jgi:hypothetical protein
VTTTGDVETGKGLINDNGPTANSAAFSHNLHGSGTTFGLAQGSNGSTFINYVDSPGQFIYLLSGGGVGGIIAIMDKNQVNIKPEVKLDDLAGATSDTVGVQADGTLYRLGTSSRRFKTDIRPYESAPFEKILEMQPVLFRYLDRDHGPTDEDTLGFIAEELEALGLKDLVIYAEDGEVHGIRYNRIPVYILEVIKRQQKQIEALETALERARSDNSEGLTALQDELDQIRALMASPATTAGAK